MTLTGSVDIFTALCVLCILEGLANEKRSLLEDTVGDPNGGNCFDMGMEFLQAASPSSRLVSRYIAILQQLRGEHADEDPANGLKQADHVVQHASTDTYNSASTPEDFEEDTSWWATYFPETTFGTNFDLTNLDDASFGMGTFKDVALGSAPKEFSEAYTSW